MRLLLQAAHVVARQKYGYLPAQFRRIAARRGKKHAGMAVAHSILVIIYHLLQDGVAYEEHGETFFEERDRQLTEKRLVRQLERLGHQVSLQPRIESTSSGMPRNSVTKSWAFSCEADVTVS